jgi:hypothetical protein
MLDTPNGVPKCSECQFEEGHSQGCSNYKDESFKQYQEDIKAGVDVSGVSLTQLKEDLNGLVLPEKWSDYAKEKFPKENLEKQTIKNQGWNNCLEAVNSIISYHIQETYDSMWGKLRKEDIEAGVDVGGVLKEEIKIIAGKFYTASGIEIKLPKEEGPKHPEHICRFNDHPQSCECYDKGYEKCKIEMLSTIKGLKCNPENDSLTIARILNELQ